MKVIDSINFLLLASLALWLFSIVRERDDGVPAAPQTRAQRAIEQGVTQIGQDSFNKNNPKTTSVKIIGNIPNPTIGG